MGVGRCHSSIRTGRSPSNSRAGSACATARSAVVQAVRRPGALERRAGLTDALWALQGDGRQRAHELVELVVKDAALVGGRHGHWVSLPLRRLAPDHFDSLDSTVSTETGRLSRHALPTIASASSPRALPLTAAAVTFSGRHEMTKHNTVEVFLGYPMIHASERRFLARACGAAT